MSRNGLYRDPTVVTARPVVPGPIAEYTQPWALTTGSQLNEAAESGKNAKSTPLGSVSSLDEAQGDAPWPGIINGAVKFFNSWRPNAFREIANHNVAGNYGARSSVADYGYRNFEFDGYDGGLNGKVAGLPMAGGGGQGPRLPTWNTLLPIIYGLRVENPATAGSTGTGNVVPQSVVSQFTNPVEFTPTGTAVLMNRGAVLR